ncbi:MAG TPA: SUF system NifU family Fe-S cluster assembly protein [Gemmatimonadales bacterium]|nr:SUF system NifU family Fe-S cluster assembly protein [Gemmatimonadales bacterium]
MTPDLAELYQSLILDHNRSPRNFRAMEGADGRAEGYNPLCGDEITVWVKRDADRIVDISFQGQGCAISRASASLMTAAVKGKTIAEAERLFSGFHALITGDGPPAPAPELGKLAALAGVAEFPIRVKCASLSWHALHAALQQKDGVVSSE